MNMMLWILVETLCSPSFTRWPLRLIMGHTKCNRFTSWERMSQAENAERGHPLFPWENIFNLFYSACVTIWYFLNDERVWQIFVQFKEYWLTTQQQELSLTISANKWFGSNQYFKRRAYISASSAEAEVWTVTQSWFGYRPTIQFHWRKQDS